ncbi:Prenylcysteine oxidase [Xylona heveae TC161]|uniref:Prenylcysteine oxidase n=1 Tax=Xylona heveae (strain CBS 132557 / TC161) TaxID=1328760 RepID=A0A165I8N4_XYLHT|nr:Prenylcysteine oxidase [Xylona heveae TC161]KZF24544.1 Prenylcysteine oxidase [Xylona heveae TC161]
MFLGKSLLVLGLLQASFGHAYQDNDEPQTVLSDQAVKRVAIIGAGAGGASAAYHLDKYAQVAGIKANITVFERSSHVGGRSTTVNVFDDLSEPVELGASIFVKVNKILVTAAEELGLTVSSADLHRPKESSSQLGVWDGERIVFSQDDNGYSWWNIAKLLWKYGWAPIRTQNLMQEIVGKFLKMYDEPYFPWQSLSQVSYDLGLTAVTSETGAQFLESKNILPPFSTEIIQASTRVNYAQNLPFIHGLETMVCMATDGAMAVQGGNWRIFDGMIKAAHAQVKLDTKVTDVIYQHDGTYVISSASSPSSLSKDFATEPEDTINETFDTVILATPLQFSNINLDAPLIEKRPDKIPYVTLHVTLLSSPHRLSAEAFNLPAGSSSVPEIILTTLPKETKPEERAAGVGPAGFFSISTLRSVRNHAVDPPRKEYLYKIFSPHPVNATFLGHILGLSEPPVLPDPPVSQDVSEDEVQEGSTAKPAVTAAQPSGDVTWIYRKAWHSYPYLYPRVTFDEPLLGNSLYYTSGIESFISTMETSALAGMNVARLLADSWLGKTPSSSSSSSPPSSADHKDAVTQDAASSKKTVAAEL